MDFYPVCYYWAWWVLQCFWAVRSGQYDDMDGAANRVLMDDDNDPEETEDQADKETQEQNEVRKDE